MKENQLHQDKWDMMIDKFAEYRALTPQANVSDLVNKIEEEFNHTMDTKFIFYLCERILKFWMDMEDDYFPIVTSWIIGTYFFDVFVTYPYVFINAVKRSGKTRLLKLMSYLVKEGVYTMSLKEAVIFRLPSIIKCGLFIDETESISSKEKSDLRELLNVAYKKGGVVYRMRKNPQTERYVPEAFQLFIPISMANITGLDDVLNDRCLTITLERSYDPKKLRLIEAFDLDPMIKLFRYLMLDNSRVSLVLDFVQKTLYIWFTELNTNSTNNTNNTIDTNDTKSFLDKEIYGRDLELWLPLFLIKKVFTEDMDDLIYIAEKFVNERKNIDIMEDQDTSMLIFLHTFIQGRDEKEWIDYSEICRSYNESEGMDPKSKHAMNSYILSRVLKRLKIVVDKRRLSTTRQVRLNFGKLENRAKRMGLKIVEDEKIEKPQEFIDKT